MRLLVLSALILGLGCTRTRGSAAHGDACRSDFDCAHGYCAAAAGAEPRCTISCARNTECPEGWSCGGVTEGGVVVCIPGAATPFGY